MLALTLDFTKIDETRNDLLDEINIELMYKT